MSRSEKITQILARRAGHSKSLEVLDAHLASVTTALARLDDSRLELLERLAEEARDRLFDIGQDIRELDESLKQQRADISKLVARLNRPTLNVGMVGRARMGKSRFLQSLTGLTAQEIPDGRTGFCTGVASLIQHAAGQETRAAVYLHDEGSFLGEVIEPYFKDLGLGNPPASARVFAERPLPALTSDEPRAKSAYLHLAAYHRHFGAYGDLLRHPSPIDIAAQEIRSYVAQDNREGTQEHHAFRAVRSVDIRTCFPAPDVGGLAVVDLPGLGDTNLGDPRILLAALQDDIDVVLFVREPAARGDDIQDFDIDLYTLASDALPEIPLRLRAFLVINHRRSDDQDNHENALRYQAKVADSPIQVVDSVIVDCSRPQEVADAFEPMLDYLLAHADELDGLLLAQSRRQTREIKARLGWLIEQAGQLAVLAQPSSIWFQEFQHLFNGAFDRLTISLERMVGRLESLRDAPDEAFGTAVAEVIRKAAADDAIPSEAEIATRIARVGARANAFGELLTESRAHLSRHFLDLDDVLRTRVMEMQDAVAQMLSEEGELRALSQLIGRDFLLAIADRVPPVSERSRGESEIRFGLTMLADFELAYRGFIQHRIRPCLDGMHPDHPEIPVAEGIWPTVSPRMMRDVLTLTYEAALGECDKALQRILAEPNGALFAIVEEFRDRVRRSADSRDQWQAFYMHVRAEVWAGPLGALAERSGQFRPWNQGLDQLRACLRAAAWQSPAVRDQGEAE
jgi:hypothetical protein